MAESTIIKTKRDGTLTFKDNGAVNTYTVAYEAGDLSFDVPAATVNNFLDRGRFPAGNPSIRYGDDQPITGSFTANLRDISDATDVTLAEIFLQSGQVGSTWVSTMGPNGEVFTMDLEWTVAGLVHGDTADHTCTFTHCYVTGSIAEGDPDVITINFVSFSEYPTVT